MKSIRNLVVILGDQLNYDSAAFDEFDKDQDLVWMAEVAGEANHVWNHKARIALFLSAMRHFRQKLERRDVPVDYRRLDDDDNQGSLADELAGAIERHDPQRVIVVTPGEWRVRQSLIDTCEQIDCPLEEREDRHFFCSQDQFAEHAEGRKQLRLEYFYRELRRKHDVLMEDGEPVGGQWNYDQDNRGTFGKEGPEDLPEVRGFRPNQLTREVFKIVENRFGDHPGRLDEFDWPVRRRHARQVLEDFIDNRLARFGEYQDAMWTGEPYLYHSRLSTALNLKLLDPREVVSAAEEAYYAGTAPLNAVEGFVRQVLGWREYVRGIYWMHMPQYLQRNELDAAEPLPAFFWNGDTDMECLRQAIGQTLKYGYAHHIQRLMVTGLFSMMLGVDPVAVHEWYLAVYVDAVEWVELPNSLGMSQYADGGVMASKPYAATGKYIQRMSNYCQNCCYDPAKATGEDACPFTTLYWDFLMKHREKLSSNSRMSLQLKNIDRKDDNELSAIRDQAKKFRKQLRSISQGS